MKGKGEGIKKAGSKLLLPAFLAGPTRLELATSGVTGRRSNQLNYDPVFPINKCPSKTKVPSKSAANLYVANREIKPFEFFFLPCGLVNAVLFQLGHKGTAMNAQLFRRAQFVEVIFP